MIFHSSHSGSYSLPRTSCPRHGCAPSAWVLSSLHSSHLLLLLLPSGLNRFLSSILWNLLVTFLVAAPGLVTCTTNTGASPRDVPPALGSLPSCATRGISLQVTHCRLCFKATFETNEKPRKVFYIHRHACRWQCSPFSVNPKSPV